MEEKIFEILKNVFELETVDASCSQMTCEAWDSIGQLNLVAELEDAFNVCFEPDEIVSMKSYEDIVRLITKKM